MCGIAGYLDFTQTLEDPQIVKNMLSRIEYRGPDESGVYVGEHIGLGNVRLSIIDLANGKQPMSDPDGNLWIVFNGEIFNYIELRNDLRKLGYDFKTTSDTEVLLLLYKEFGERCLERLNGQFVFAIWDRKKEELFLARDRMGIRPLFYTLHKNSFIFGSEIKCIFTFPDMQPEIDYQSLAQIFTYWTTLTPFTAFKNIFELSPGCFMKVNHTGRQVKKYWQLKFPQQDQHRNESDVGKVAEEFEYLLTSATEIRLRADVPVAAYLSGGLDSSATTYIIKKVKPEILHTFSIGFSEDEFDETTYQEEVSLYLNTVHKAFECSNADIAAHFPEVVWHSEIPLFRTGPVPMYLLSKNVHENGIKVVITGEGADEMLAGYNIFKEAMIREFWSRQPGSRYRPLLLQKLYPYLGQFQGKNKNLLKFFFGYKLGETDSPYYSHLIRWNNTERLKTFFSADVRHDIEKLDPYETLTGMLPDGFGNWDLLSRAQWLETTIFMSGYLLSSQGDRMAMANSVEGRYPFLDHRMVEFCAKLPENLKLKGLTEKYLLKKAMKNRLPSRIVSRPKQAYRAPIAGSFLGKKAPGYVKEYLSAERIDRFQLFDSKMVRTLTERISGNSQVTELDNMALAGILSTQILVDYFIYGHAPGKTTQLKSNCRVVYDSFFIKYR